MPLSYEDKSIRLQAIVDPDSKEKKDARIAALPKKLQKIARVGEAVHPPPFTSFEERLRETKHQAERQRQNALALDALTQKQRLRIFAAWHPELARTIDYWWEASKSYPYQVGRQRRAFRVPNDRESTAITNYAKLTGLDHWGAQYQRDIVWHAAWGDNVSGLYYLQMEFLAATIDRDPEMGDAVFDILVEIVNGENEIASVNGSTIGALLIASRPQGWELVEKLLLAAQRQEGLRQTILEQIDLANPEAFARMLRVIIDNNLIRFASTIRAVAVWFGLPLDVENQAEAKELVEFLDGVLSDKKAMTSALASDEPPQVYAALVASAMTDADAAVVTAEKLVKKASIPTRIAIAQFLGAVGLAEGQETLIGLLDDPDLEVAWTAFRMLQPHLGTQWHPAQFDASAPLHRLLDRMPDELTIQPVLLGSEPTIGMRNDVLDGAMRHSGTAMDPFVQHFDAMNAHSRSIFAGQCGLADSVSPEVRSCLLRAVGGRGSSAASVAMQTLEKLKLEPADAEELEPLLTRKTAKLRQGVVALLASLEPDACLASAERLWATGNTQQRDAACELAAGLTTDEAATARRDWAEGATERQIQLLGESAAAEAAEHDIFHTKDRTPAIQPSGIPKPGPLVTSATSKLISALDDLAEEYKNVEVEFTNWNGTHTQLVADIRHFWPPPGPNHPKADEVTMLLDEVVRQWARDRPDEMRDTDGFEFLRAQLALPRPYSRYDWSDRYESLLGYSAATVRHPHLVRHWAMWLGVDSICEDFVDELVTRSEFLAQEITADEIEGLATMPSYQASQSWPHEILHSPIMNFLHSERVDQSFTNHQLGRLWRLERWVTHPAAVGDEVTFTLQAYEAGEATEADARWALKVGHGLHSMTARRRNKADLKARPKSYALAEQFRDDVVEAELARGDLPTSTSDLVRRIVSVEGADLAMRLVARLGTLSWSRGYVWGNDKKGTISHLIRACYPSATDSAATLLAAAEAHGVKEKRLVEFGVYAPQWASYVETALDWSGFEEAVWWIHAHTKDTGWTVSRELRETWEALSAERTPLSAEDLLDGAVDIEWFWRVHDELGSKRWKQVYDAGKYASSGAGHRRAQIFADALTGTITEKDVITRVEDKRHQDSVRGLGLLPLPKSAKAREAAKLKRYQVLREFERGSRKFGAQRQTSEKTAMRIGLENLARNAGYRDPARFAWAMEAEELADLADGPIEVKIDDVTVTLSIDDRGVADLTVDRAGKPLKQVPAKMRKRDEIVEVRERKRQLTNQVSRVR